MADPRKALQKLIQSLGESSRFVACGSLSPVLPGLTVDGIGPIGSPISAADAKRLIAKATQAPYGRGEDTIVDTKVRRVWQLEPSQFTLRNAEWVAQLEAIVAAVQQEFGIHGKIKADLYKLLVYEKGDFFAPHRDTEKTEGMFATLVVGLPAWHEGGALIVQHDGQVKKIEFGGKESEFKTHYAAFYADCQHEIKPVSRGYRVCLVYNLSLAGKKKQPAAPQCAPAVTQAAALLQKVFDDPSSERQKLAIPFQHQYTEAGLDPHRLKGADRALADVLARAAESLDYQVYLALLTHHQSGSVDYGSWDGGYQSRRSYRWSYREDDEDEDEDEGEDVGDDDGAEMEEVFDEEWTLEHWLDSQGQKQPFGTLHLDEEEVLDPEDKENWSRRQEVTEATGNEGASMDRWYRQCVLVLWPRDRYFGVLASEGQASALPALEEMVKRDKKRAAVEECRAFAAAIIAQWRPRQGYYEDVTAYSTRMLKVLERVGAVELVQCFIRDLLPKDFDGTEGKAIQLLVKRWGWEALAGDLLSFLDQQKPQDHLARLDAVVAVCEPACCESLPPDEPARAALAAALARVIERWDAARARTDPWFDVKESRAEVVERACRIFAALSPQDHLDAFVRHVLTDQRHYDLREALIPAIQAIYGWLAKVPAARSAAGRILEHCLTELRTATAQPVEPPKDWKRPAALACKCADCRALAEFLRDPGQRQARFPLRKDRRQHLHQQIDQHRLDCTHVTERKGSPQTLVCTKTQASYERRKQHFETDQKTLAQLEKLAAGKRPAARCKSKA